jgi:hypothetical protein
MLPHVIWLSRSDYAPFRYASRHFLASDHSPLEQIGLAFGHHLALLILPFLLFVWVIRRSRVDPDTEIRWARAQSIWIIAACLVIVPPVMALGLHVYLAVDWGNSLYFFVPLAAVLYPRLALSNKAVVRAGRVWGATVLCALLAAPLFQWAQKRVDPGRYAWQLADVSQAVSTLWHDHYTCPMPVIAGPKFAAAAVSFYSPDHPILFTNFDTTVATWIDLGDLRRSGFAAICPAGLIQCEEVARAIDPAAEHVPIRISSALHKDWIVYLMRKTDAGRASC